MTNDPLAFEFFNEIGIIDQLVGTMLDSVLPPGITRAQFTVLNHFVRLNISEKSPADLANAFQVRRPTMTSTLARMEHQRLIAIRPNPDDARGKLVSLTGHGREMRQRCLAALAPLVPLIESIVSVDEMTALLPALKRIRKELDEARN